MTFASEVLRSFLLRKQIATLEELKQALATTSTKRLLFPGAGGGSGSNGCGGKPRPMSREIEEPAVGGELSPELKAGIILFYSLLDERQRRLYAGLEAHKVGHGGDRKIAEFLGLDVHTVARGRRELLGGEVERQRIRQAGGGRKRGGKKSPQ
jgi:hypothetical protein